MSNPINAETDATTGSRWYVHPTTGERFISVTTVLSNIAKFGLADWAARLAAEAAVEHLEWLNLAVKGDPCGRKGESGCGMCSPCAIWWLSDRHNQVRDAAADLGTKLHDAGEQDALFGEGYTIDEDVQPYVDGYKLWRDRWKPTFLLTEATVISRKWGYAGTLDIGATFAEANLPPKFAHFADVPVLGDYKTGKHLDIPKGWQLNAYKECDAILLPDGTELPMPEFERAMILHIRRIEDPDGDRTKDRIKVQVREVHLTKHNHNNFVHMLRVAEGLSAGLGTVLSRPYTLKEN